MFVDSAAAQKIQSIVNEDVYGLVYYDFQPIYSASTDIIGMEALGRCRFTYDLATAGVFTSARIRDVPIDVQIDAFIRSLGRFSKSNWGDSWFVTFNVDPIHFTKDVIEYLSEQWGLAGFKNDLVVELTETHGVESIDTNLVQYAASLGLTTFLDDFGAGHSNVMALVNLPLRGVKFDKFFLSMCKCEFTLNIFKTLHNIVKKNGLFTIVEGIETFEGFQIAKELGAHGFQGFYLSKPVSGDVHPVTFRVVE